MNALEIQIFIFNSLVFALRQVNFLRFNRLSIQCQELLIFGSNR